MAEEEKKKIEEAAEEKKKDVPWWQNLSRPIIIGAAVIGFLIIRSMMMDVENRNTYFFWLGALVLALYLLSQRPAERLEAMISPREAELLVERDLERKRRWGQLPPMCSYEVGPQIELKHTGGRGIHYNVSCTINDPYSRPKHMIATVIPKGVERGFVTFRDAIGQMTGREVVQEKPIVPDWIMRAEEFPVLKDIYLREKL